MQIGAAWVYFLALRTRAPLRRCLASPLECLHNALRQAQRHWPSQSHRFPPAEEQAFQTFHADRAYPQARFGIALGFLAWCLFAVWDLLAFPGLARPLITIRLLLVAPILGGLWWFIAHHPASFKARMPLFLSIGPVAASLGLLMMMAVTQSSSSPRAFNLLWPAFNGICFFQYAFLGLAFVPAAILGLSCLLLVSLFGIASSASLQSVAGVALELAVLNVLGMIVCARSEIHQRTLFRMRQHYRRQVAAAREGREQARRARDEALAERQRAESAMALVQRQSAKVDELTREKEGFFKSAYHDLQQPLSIIGLYARLARSKLGQELERDIHADLAVIEGASHEIAMMFKGVRDTWEIGRAEPDLGPVDLAGLLAEISSELRDQAERKGLRMRLRLPKGASCRVKTDRVLLKRAISNLVSNGIKYTEAGGIVITAAPTGRHVRVVVRDTGVGIPETFHDRIFEEYFRVEDPGAARPRGLGLGLSIVSRIEKTLPDHTLRFWSRPGRGSRFSFTIPQTTDSVSDHALVSGAVGPPRPQPLAGKYVFIVEDERLILDGLVEAIRTAGCMVEGVKCVEAARDLLSSRDRCPDVLVTDYRLQHGQTGMDVVSVMRDRFEWAATTPILFVTGELNWPAPSDGFTGRWDVFRKPIDPDVLVQRLGELVNHPHP